MFCVTTFSRNVQIFIFCYLEKRCLKYSIHLKLFSLKIKRCIKSTASRYLDLSMVIISQSKFNSDTQYSKSFLLLFVTPKPSSINLWSKTGHTNFVSIYTFPTTTFPVKLDKCQQGQRCICLHNNSENLLKIFSDYFQELR